MWNIGPASLYKIAIAALARSWQSLSMGAGGPCPLWSPADEISVVLFHDLKVSKMNQHRSSNILLHLNGSFQWLLPELTHVFCSDSCRPLHFLHGVCTLQPFSMPVPIDSRYTSMPATFIFLRDKKIQGSDLRDKLSGTFVREEADR